MASLQSTIVDGAIINKEGTTPLAINPRTLRIDYSTGTTFETDMSIFVPAPFSGNGPNVFDVINADGGTYYKSFILKVTAYTVGGVSPIFDWSSINNVKWHNGNGPTLTNANPVLNDKIDIYSFSSWDDGTTWYGKVIGQNYS